MDYSKLGFATRQIHAGLDHTPETGARGVPIYPTAAYRFRTCEHAAQLFELSTGGNIYTRLQNPTTGAYEERVAALCRHGLNFHETFGKAAFIVKCRVDGLRDFGPCPSPFDSYLMMLGLETLSLRVSAGLEDVEDIIKDFEQAFEHVG